MRTELDRSLQRRPGGVAPGTLDADARRYLAQVKHLASYKSRVCEIDAWTAFYGRLRHVQITAARLGDNRLHTPSGELS